MSYLDQSLDAALLSNTATANAVAAGSNGSGVGALGSHESDACLESAQPDSKASAKDAQGLASSNASKANNSSDAHSSGSKSKLSVTNLKIYAALAPFDGVELSGSALFSLAEDTKWFTRPETKIFEYLQEVGRCSLEALKRKTGVRALTLTRVLSFFEHLELVKLSSNEVCLLQNQPVDFAQPVVKRDAVKEAKITLDLKAICDRSMKLFNNTVFEALRKFKAINVLDLRAFSGVSPARFLSCCGQLLATGKAVYKAGVLYWASRGLLVKPRSVRKPQQENHQDDIEPDGTCNGPEGQGHGAATKGSALSPKGATVASSTATNMPAVPAERHDMQGKAVIDIDLDQMIYLSDRVSPRSVSQATSSFVLSFEADAQAAMDPVKAPFSEEPLEVPALASSFEKSVTMSGSAFPSMVRTALCTVPDMWLEFATYSGCTLVEPVERGYSVWDVVPSDASDNASNTQQSHEPVVANNAPQLSSGTVGRGAVGQRDSTCPLDQNADQALVPELVEEDEESEVASTDTYASHVGNETGAEVLAQDLCSEHKEQALPADQTILVPQSVSGQEPDQVEPRPTHKELSAPVPEKVPPSCVKPSPLVYTSATSVHPETGMPRIEQPSATAQIVPTSVARPVVPPDLGAGAVNQREHVSGWQSPSQSLNAHTSLNVAQPNRGQLAGTRPVVNNPLPIPPQCMHPAWLAPSSFNDAEKRQEEKRRKAENYRRAEALVKRQFFAERARQEAQEAVTQGAGSQPNSVVGSVQPQAQVQPRPQVQMQPQTRVQAQPYVQAQVQPWPQPQVQPQVQPHSQTQLRPQPQVQPHVQAQPQPRPQVQPQVQPRPQVQAQSYGQARPQMQSQPHVQAQPQPRPQVQPQMQAQAQPRPQPQVQAQSYGQVHPQVQPQVQPQPQVHGQVQAQVQPQAQVPPNGAKSGRKLPIDYMRHYVEPELRPDMTKTLEYRVIKMWCYQGEFGSMTPSPELIRLAAQAYSETIGREVTPNDAPAIFELLEALHKRRVEQARQKKQSKPN